MGAFIANIHVRSDAFGAVQQAIADIGVSRFRVSGPRKGWVSLCEERASTQDEAWIERLAADLSSRLGTVCVVFMVHDSDIARYWLIDRGRLLDEYNSVPDYFDEVSAADKRRVRGQADVFLRYCQPSVSREQIETVLRTQVVFAKDTIRQLAEFLGIDPERALEDFRDHDPSGGSGGSHGFDGDEDEDDGVNDELVPGLTSAPSGMAKMMQTMQQHLASMFVSTEDQAMSAESNALVQAAATGDTNEIDRLVEAGANVNAPGMLPLDPFAGASPLEAGLAPQMAISPLMAAASRGKPGAVQRLIALGANVNEVHPLYGTALHVAAQSGSPETVQIFLGAGIPANTKNKQGHTPRTLIQAMRSQIEMARTWAKSMPQLQPVLDKLLAKIEGMQLPEAGWKECEERLLQAGG
jgi:hypothetical protein